MSETTDVVRSKTKKNGASRKRHKTLGICVVCNVKIPTLLSVLDVSIPLPPVLNNIVGEYLTLGSHQFVGYAILHSPTRRCYHVSCESCRQDIIYNTLDDGQETRMCPVQNCGICIYVLDIHQNVLK